MNSICKYQFDFIFSKIIQHKTHSFKYYCRIIDCNVFLFDIIQKVFFELDPITISFTKITQHDSYTQACA